MERMQQDMSGFCLTRHIPLLLLLQPERLGFYAKIRAIFGTLLCVNKITAPKIKKAVGRYSYLFHEGTEFQSLGNQGPANSPEMGLSLAGQGQVVPVHFRVKELSSRVG